MCAYIYETDSGLTFAELRIVRTGSSCDPPVTWHVIPPPHSIDVGEH